MVRPSPCAAQLAREDVPLLDRATEYRIAGFFRRGKKNFRSQHPEYFPPGLTRRIDW